jgi:hypothetical protein
MGVAPSPSGRRVEDLGDRLVLFFRPQGWSNAIFLMVWALVWTIGGLTALLHLPDSTPGEAAFLLVWLSGWFFGECFVLLQITWLLVGRELLSLSPDSFELRWEIGRFARSKWFDPATVHSVSAERVPHDEEDEKPRKDFGLRISHGGDIQHFGEGMSRGEAEHVATVIESRLRPRTWWDDEAAFPRRISGERTPAEHTTFSAGQFTIAEPNHKRFALAAVGAVACVTLTGALLAAALGEERRSPVAPRAASPPAAPDVYALQRTYASATTAQTLMAAGITPEGLPRCSGNADWTRWSCRVRAHTSAGRTSTYVCRSIDVRTTRCRRLVQSNSRERTAA